MPKRIISLSFPQVDNAKARAKDYKLSDGEGLHLLVTHSGGKLWRFQYRYAGKQKTLAFGSFPEISIADARNLRDKARKEVAKGIDPGEVKKALKILELAQATVDANTFELIARRWHQHKNPEWSKNHSDRLLHRLELDVFPTIGKRPIVDIKRSELVGELRRVSARTVETAIRLKIAFYGIFRFALDEGLIDQNPAGDLKGIVPRVKTKHMSAPTQPRKVAELIKTIDGFTRTTFVTKCAIRLAPLVFIRPGELRSAEWSEFDLDSSVWNIPGEKMKMKEPHLVPLSKQAVMILREIHILTGQGKYVFCGHRSPTKYMSENTVNQALRRMGFEKDEISGHGFRAIARTLLHEVLGFLPDPIEAQLAHAVPDRLGTAYNRTQFIDERKRMMQSWSDYLDELKKTQS
jgi:integrase